MEEKILQALKSQRDLAWLEAVDLTTLNVNYSRGGCTLLYRAISLEDSKFAFRLMLTPGIDLNATTQTGFCPLLEALFEGKWDIIVFLLNHPGYHLHLKRRAFETADAWQNTKAVKLFLTCLRPPMSRPLQFGHEKIKRLWDAYGALPFEFVREWRKDLGISHFGPPTLFIWPLLITQGYYAFRTIVIDKPLTVRFYKLLLKLPVELQMLVCNRVFDLPDTFMATDLIATTLKLYITENFLQ